MARALRLRITEPGTLFSRLVERDITAETYALIVQLVDHPDDYVVIKRDVFVAPSRRQLGFGRPDDSPEA